MLILRKLGFSVLAAGPRASGVECRQAGQRFPDTYAPPAASRKWEPWWKFWARPRIALKYLPTRTVSTPPPGFLPGVYNLKFSAPAFLPTLREHVGLRAGGNTIVNVTLSTLFEAVQMVPGRGPAEEDDWKWVLRSVSNRPFCAWLTILRNRFWLPNAGKSDRDLKGTLSFLAGSPSEGFGSDSDMNTGFSMEKSIFSSDTIGLRGNVGYGSSSPASVLRATFRQKMDNGSEPSFAMTMRNLPAPDITLHSFQALALTTSDSFSLGDVVELKFGSELQTIQFMGRVTTFRPFGTADLHLSPNTVLEYRYATSEPDIRMDKGFDSAPADINESAAAHQHGWILDHRGTCASSGAFALAPHWQEQPAGGRVH